MSDVPETTTPADSTAITPEEHPRSDAYRRQRAHTSVELKVLEKIARSAALSVPGVISHSSGISQFTGRRLPRISVRMDPAGHAAVADVQVATAWPAPTVAVAQVTRETVAEWIEHTTGVPVLAVNVDVAAVVPVDTAAVTVEDLEQTPRTPELTRITATPLTAVAPQVDRGVPEPHSPVTRRRPRVEHPRALDGVDLTPVTTGSPVVPRHVKARSRGPVRRPTDPVPPRLTPVDAPLPTSVRHPVTPPAPDVLHPRAPFSPSRPRPLNPVIVDRVTVEVPAPARGLPILYDVPTPAGPPMRDIPTPRGLQTRAVPTPRGLELTVFPTVRRHRRIPVTVNTSRRWGKSDRDDRDDLAAEERTPR